MKRLLVYLTAAVLSLGSPRADSQVLILEDIGPYTWGGRHNIIPGFTALGITGRRPATGDQKLETSYRDRSREIGVQVTISTHENPTWVLHELEGMYRPHFDERFSEGMSLIGGPGTRRFQLVMTFREAVSGSVAWLSGESTVVHIDFTLRGANRTHEVPTEVVDAYLALYPSSLPDSIQDTPEHHTDFIRKEFERILAYAARDLAVGQAGAEQAELSALDVEKWMTNFATYREFYFKVGSGEEFRSEVLEARIKNTPPGEHNVDYAKHFDWLEARLSEFQTWWAAHQNDPVQLPTPEAAPATSPSPAPTP
jgi:hypothetical protein